MNQEAQATQPTPEELAAQQAAAAEAEKGKKEPTPDELWTQAQTDRNKAQAGNDEIVDAEGKPDPLASLPEPVANLVKEIQAKQAEQEAALKDTGQKLAKAHGTIGNLTQKLNKSLQDLQRVQPVIDDVEQKRKAEQDAAKTAKEARRKELGESMAELPDVKEYIELMVGDAKPPEKEAPAKPAAEVETPEMREARLVAERELSDRHPKWIETVKSTEFKTWLEKQPEDIKALGASDSVDDADQMLTAYKKHKEDAAKVAQVEAERQERLRRGEKVEGERGSASKDGDTSPDALWNKAKREREKSRSANA